MLHLSKIDGSCILQGDIITDVTIINDIKFEESEITKINFPYVVVLSQSCDLEQNYTEREEFRKYIESKGKINSYSTDKYVFSALVLPFFNSEQFNLGMHLSSINSNLKMQKPNERKFENSKFAKNQVARYHYLDFPEEYEISKSIIDFKHFYTCSLDYLTDLRKTNYIATIDPLYREFISQRFAYYLSRIGLPSDKKMQA